MSKSFAQRLASVAEANRSLLCVGLDVDPSLMAIPDVAEFNRAIIDATHDLVCAYKPNLPFYEALGLAGLRSLEETVSHIRSVAPDVALIGDGKRGDIGSTNAMYARALFEVWGFDAATVNCWAGGEALEPFLEYADKGVFIWCRSSNPGAAEFQDLVTPGNGGSKPLYQWVAHRANEWDRNGNVGLVVGSTYPEELSAVRDICPTVPVLAPGVGAQSGDLRATVSAGMDRYGRNLIVSSSRGVLYASKDPSGFADAARDAAQRLRDSINKVLEEEGKAW